MKFIDIETPNGVSRIFEDDPQYEYFKKVYEVL